MTDDERDERIIRIDENMKVVVGRLNDHGTRIRALEQFRNLAGGAIAVLAAIAAAVKINVGGRNG